LTGHGLPDRSRLGSIGGFTATIARERLSLIGGKTIKTEPGSPR